MLDSHDQHVCPQPTGLGVVHLLRRLRGRRPTLPSENFIGFDKYARSGAYHWKEMQTTPDYRAKAEFVAKRVEPGTTVLDVGCGDGAYMHLVASKAREVVGVDADAEAVRLANRMLRKHGSRNTSVFQLPISSLSLAELGRDLPFDTIYSMDVIEHLPNPVELGDRIQAVARTGSVILIGTPANLGDHLVSPYHVREFSSDEFRSLISSTFGDCELHTLPMKRLDGHLYEAGFL